MFILRKNVAKNLAMCLFSIKNRPQGKGFQQILTVYLTNFGILRKRQDFEVILLYAVHHFSF